LAASEEDGTTTRTPVATKRLVLRPWRETDREPFAALSADPEVMRHLMPLATRAASDAWIDRQQVHLQRHGFCMWAVSPVGSETFIGCVGLLQVGYEAHFAPAVEVGWRLARASWGQGFAPEAAAAALAFGFDVMGLGEIVANTVPANTNSQRVMIKLRMGRDPGDDFDHPTVPPGHMLRRQVLYRISLASWKRRDDAG
jgi:RimJ/RimL family protein N-acetyltransferase